MDIGCTLRSEVGDEIGDLTELSAASERCGLRARIALAQIIDGDAARVGECLLIGKGTQPRCLKDAGRHCDHADAELAEFLCP